jgi:hypothetical protein
MSAIIMKNDAKRKPHQIGGASLFNNPVKLLEDGLNFQCITRIEQIVI